jgi:hypothetical protein
MAIATPHEIGTAPDDAELYPDSDGKPDLARF